MDALSQTGWPLLFYLIFFLKSYRHDSIYGVARTIQSTTARQATAF